MKLMQFLTATFVLLASANLQCAEGSDAEQKQREQSENYKSRAEMRRLMNATQASRLQAQRKKYVSGHGDCSCSVCLTKKNPHHSRHY